jgi:hypothetical protein
MEDGKFQRIVGVILIIAFCCFFFFVRGCSDSKQTRETLEAAGYTKIEVGDWEFGCGNDDSFCTGFKATGPSGVRSRGVVGCGWVVKGCTIRALVGGR